MKKCFFLFLCLGTCVQGTMLAMETPKKSSKFKSLSKILSVEELSVEQLKEIEELKDTIDTSKPITRTENRRTDKDIVTYMAKLKTGKTLCVTRNGDIITGSHSYYDYESRKNAEYIEESDYYYRTVKELYYIQEKKHDQLLAQELLRMKQRIAESKQSQ